MPSVYDDGLKALRGSSPKNTTGTGTDTGTGTVTAAGTGTVTAAGTGTVVVVLALVLVALPFD